MLLDPRDVIEVAETPHLLAVVWIERQRLGRRMWDLLREHVRGYRGDLPRRGPARGLRWALVLRISVLLHPPRLRCERGLLIVRSGEDVSEVSLRLKCAMSDESISEPIDMKSPTYLRDGCMPRRSAFLV